MKSVENSIAEILERNRRVEADKAWEQSWTRTFLIAAMIYVIAGVFLWSLAVSAYLLQALIPTCGWILSTASIPWIKRWWLANRKI